MPTLADALRKQKSRSARARAQDARKTSKRVVQPTNKKGVASWIKNNGRRTDIRGIDTAGSGRAPAKAKTTTVRRKPSLTVGLTAVRSARAGLTPGQHRLRDSAVRQYRNAVATGRAYSHQPDRKLWWTQEANKWAAKANKYS